MTCIGLAEQGARTPLAALAASSGMPATEDEVIASDPPALPPDVLRAMAHAALRAEGYSVRAWERLCRVHSTWRADLKGGHLTFHRASI